MQKSIFFVVALLSLLLLKTQHSFAQRIDTVVYQVHTNDGNLFTGKIILKDSAAVIFKDRNIGEITLKNNIIKDIKPITVDKKVGLLKENMQDTRYFWSPNGYGLKKGKGYYQNVGVLFNQASVGLSNYISMGAGAMPLFLFAGTASPVWLVPKVSIPIVPNKLNMGTGALLGVVAGEDNSVFGITYAVATVGSREANITFGAGWAFADGEWANSATYNLNGMFRVSDKGYLISENYFIQLSNETLSLVSFGGRTVWPKISLDYGLVFPISESTSSFLAIPWIGFMVPFGS